MSVSAEDALSLLKEGNKCFSSGKCAVHDLTRERVLTANEQHPFCVVIACSDSRETISHIFSAGIGEIFKIHTAGNVVQHGAVLGSIEYAVAHLGVKLVVVLGHSDCGAVKAAISYVNGGCKDESEHVRSILDQIVENTGIEAGCSMEECDDVAKRNAKAVASSLPGMSDVVKRGLDNGMKILPAFHDLKTGKVEFL